MRRLLSALLLLSVPCSAVAWGELGHRLVGALAEQQLSAATRAQVASLLEGEPEPSLAGIANWADEVRERPEFAWSRPLHYVNLRDPSCRYAAVRDCTGGECVVTAIPRFAALLADTRRPRSERRDALKLVVHFVGDIHQPLHAGHRPDKGGNEFQINYDGEGTSLHGVWDYHLLASAGLDQAAYAKHLLADARSQRTPSAPGGFSPAYVAAWAEVSCTLTNIGLYPARPGKLPPGYVQQMRPRAEMRVRDAAHALAQLLESALGGNAPP
jgi:hypothetical protein